MRKHFLNAYLFLRVNLVLSGLNI